MTIKKIMRGVRREEQHEKKRRAPRGGTLASQVLHTVVRKGYAGTPKNLKKKAVVSIFG